ncbi:hypothetical protein [Caldicellulosiruptor bescii]|uniref:hypothetical protein n=1 Tax=Caldicellulosiruptor bescii TaxID=31899 RepID=UPI00211969F0|nr:hypothetical protein [Caldicellulosiruptor bescii]
MNNQPIPPDVLERYREDGAQPVWSDKKTVEKGYTVVEEGLLSISNGLIRHNSAKLARVVSNIVYGKDVIHEYRLGYLRLKNFSKPFKS